jgi:segregation and condensation protein B
MSLKAKVEAVVYAAEEPVTLAQLAAAFAEEVQEELAAAAAAIAELDATREPTPPSPESEEEEAPASAQTPEQTPEGATEATQSEGTGSSGEGPAATAAPEAEDEKKAAKRRERAIRDVLEGILNELIADYAASGRGMEIREIAGGYRMATKPEYHDAIRGFVKNLKPPMKLSLPALETLAVIAYKQPVTAPEVNEIRGVDSGGVLGSLIGRKLITTAGRKQVIGRPILYRTTKEFLMRFGLKDLNELPSMEEFEKMAGELADAQSEEDAAMNAVGAAFETSENVPAPEEEASSSEIDRELESGAPEDEDAPAPAVEVESPEVESEEKVEP